MVLVGVYFFIYNDTATTEIYTLSLHDALPISQRLGDARRLPDRPRLLGERQEVQAVAGVHDHRRQPPRRSEEHTSELQSRQYLVCRLLLEKKKLFHNLSKLTRYSITTILTMST